MDKNILLREYGRKYLQKSVSDLLHKYTEAIVGHRDDIYFDAIESKESLDVEELRSNLRDMAGLINVMMNELKYCRPF